MESHQETQIVSFDSVIRFQDRGKFSKTDRLGTYITSHLFIYIFRVVSFFSFQMFLRVVADMVLSSTRGFTVPVEVAGLWWGFSRTHEYQWVLHPDSPHQTCPVLLRTTVHALLKYRCRWKWDSHHSSKTKEVTVDWWKKARSSCTPPRKGTESVS